MTLLLIPSHYPHYTLFQKDYFSFGKSIEIKRSPSPGQGTSSTGGISQQDASTWIQTDGSRLWEANYILQSEHICRACSAEVITITAHFNASVRAGYPLSVGHLKLRRPPFHAQVGRGIICIRDRAHLHMLTCTKLHCTHSSRTAIGRCPFRRARHPDFTTQTSTWGV